MTLHEKINKFNKVYVKNNIFINNELTLNLLFKL